VGGVKFPIFEIAIYHVSSVIRFILITEIESPNRVLSNDTNCMSME